MIFAWPSRRSLSGNHARKVSFPENGMNTRQSITVHRRQPAVWQLVGHPARWHRWTSDFELLKVEEPLQVGARLSYRYRGREVEAEIEPFVEGNAYGVRSKRPTSLRNRFRCKRRAIPRS